MLLSCSGMASHLIKKYRKPASQCIHQNIYLRWHECAHAIQGYERVKKVNPLTSQTINKTTAAVYVACGHYEHAVSGAYASTRDGLVSQCSRALYGTK
jgi:hypothetical protein